MWGRAGCSGVLVALLALLGGLIVQADALIECGVGVTASPFGAGLLVAHTANAEIVIYDAAGERVEMATLYDLHGKLIDDELPETATISFEDGTDAVIESYPELENGDYLAAIRGDGGVVYQRLSLSDGALLLTVECYTPKYWREKISDDTPKR